MDNQLNNVLAGRVCECPPDSRVAPAKRSGPYASYHSLHRLACCTFTDQFRWPASTTSDLGRVTMRLTGLASLPIGGEIA